MKCVSVTTYIHADTYQLGLSTKFFLHKPLFLPQSTGPLAWSPTPILPPPSPPPPTATWPHATTAARETLHASTGHSIWTPRRVPTTTCWVWTATSNSLISCRGRSSVRESVSLRNTLTRVVLQWQMAWFIILYSGYVRSLILHTNLKLVLFSNVTYMICYSRHCTTRK